MKTYLDCWISTATALFSQALAGEPQLTELESVSALDAGQVYTAEISGDPAGKFSIMLDAGIAKAPLLGDGVDQAAAWLEFLREVVESAAGELAKSGNACRVESFQRSGSECACTRGFSLSAPGGSWTVGVLDELQYRRASRQSEENLSESTSPLPEQAAPQEKLSSSVALLLDVELEAALRFGCREMPLGEILELGPGDVVELDRHVSDPVDLVVGDKIVARGEVVLVNGNFGLRVTEVAAPQKRLESIRCLF